MDSVSLCSTPAGTRPYAYPRPSTVPGENDAWTIPNLLALRLWYFVPREVALGEAMELVRDAYGQCLMGTEPDWVVAARNYLQRAPDVP